MGGRPARCRLSRLCLACACTVPASQEGRAGVLCATAPASRWQVWQASAWPGACMWKATHPHTAHSTAWRSRRSQDPSTPHTHACAHATASWGHCGVLDGPGRTAAVHDIREELARLHQMPRQGCCQDINVLSTYHASVLPYLSRLMPGRSHHPQHLMCKWWSHCTGTCAAFSHVHRSPPDACAHSVEVSRQTQPPYHVPSAPPSSGPLHSLRFGGRLAPSSVFECKQRPLLLR